MLMNQSADLVPQVGDLANDCEALGQVAVGLVEDPGLEEDVDFAVLREELLGLLVSQTTAYYWS